MTMALNWAVMLVKLLLAQVAYDEDVLNWIER